MRALTSTPPPCAAARKSPGGPFTRLRSISRLASASPGLVGLILVALVVAGLGLRLSVADIGPKAPPLADFEAALAGPDPILAAYGSSQRNETLPHASAPRHADLELAPAAATNPATPSMLDPAGRAALAVEVAPAAVDRLLEVARGDTLMQLLVDAGVERPEAYEAITALTEVFDPRKLRTGQVVRLALQSDPVGAGEAGGEDVLRLVSLSLTPSPEEDIHVVRNGEDPAFVAQAEPRPLDFRRGAGEGTIESSLFLAAREAGVPLETIVELIRLFSFDVDFQREIQSGDRFEVLYDSYFDRTGALAKTGPVKYAALVLSGKRLEFYHFVTADGTDDHFDRTGQSVRRALLRTPIDGARISSGFGLRKHPIQGYTKMHRGVDFAAPRGTPIYAAGNGTIERIGRNGGYGRYIRIRHNGTYKTAYAHLNGYAKGLKRGSRVKQGQVIGYVGSTGRSTGPHLHYEIFVDNKQVNPRKIKLPSGKKLAGADLENFQKARAEIDRLRNQMLGDVLIAATPCEEEQVAVAEEKPEEVVAAAC